MSESLTFDPELEGLLREIAADPRSRLLRIPRSPRPRDVLAIPEPVSRARAGLSLAERHLIEVHRDEAADVMRRACLVRFFIDPQRSIYVHRSKSVGESIHVDTPDELQQRASNNILDARTSNVHIDGLSLIEACTSHDLGGTISITQLARASQLLQHTDVAEDYVGLDQVISGDRLLGERVLLRLVTTSSSPYLLSCAYEALGLSGGLHDNDRVAMERYKAAALACPGRPSSAMSWLYFATRVADRPEALHASATLGELGRIGNDVLDAFVAAHIQQDQCGAEPASHEARLLALDLKSLVGEGPGRVLDAL